VTGPAGGLGGTGGTEPAEVRMPRLGSSMQSGVVTRWLRAEGDWIAEGEPLAEISTDKVDTEIAAPASGRLRRILVGADEEAGVGAVIAWIDPAAAEA
jgi:pyruvate dehydrogenase E2 component (dihydrolipoyllysine-residue acetyltransferase)